MIWSHYALRRRWSHIETIGELVEHIEALDLDKDQEIIGRDEHGSLLLSSQELGEFHNARQYCQERAPWGEHVLKTRFEGLNCVNYWDLLHCFGDTVQDCTPELMRGLRSGIDYVRDSTRP